MSGVCGHMPEYAVKVIEALRSAGVLAYAVGACVRDSLIGREPSDWDVSTSAKPEEISALFEKTVPTGISYGTVTVIIDEYSVEVTTFRQDGEYSNGRKPDSIVFVSDITQDLSRRDFTMNAIAMGPDGEIIDPFGGREDISSRIIRCVGEPEQRFSEDALRMLRAFRFAAVLNFHIDEEILKAIAKSAHLAQRLSSERIRDELEKILMSPRPELVSDIVKYGLLSKYILPGKIGLSPIEALPKDNETRWCVFSFLVCLSGLTHFTADGLLKELKLPGKLIYAAGTAVKIAEWMPCGCKDIRMALAVYGNRCVELAAWCAEAAGKAGTWESVMKEISLGLAVPVNKLDIDGNAIKDLGFSGREIGAVLAHLSREATFENVRNKREDLLAMAEMLAKREKNRGE